MPMPEHVPEIGCHNCVGACCRAGTLMQLTAPEAEFLSQGGTQFEVIVSPEEAKEVLGYSGSDTRELERRRIAGDLPKDRGAFGLLSDCGYLAINSSDGTGKCTVYDDPKRPLACSEFQPDSAPCNVMRQHFGLFARIVRRRYS